MIKTPETLVNSAFQRTFTYFYWTLMVLTVFPNPTTGLFQITYSSTEKSKLMLYISSARGQIIYTETISKFDGEYTKEIDLSKYSKGIYFVEIIGDRKRTVRKIILE